MNKILSASILIGILLATLLGGLALVLQSLRGISLSLRLKIQGEQKR
mgnify:CR=1 FL=1